MHRTSYRAARFQLSERHAADHSASTGQPSNRTAPTYCTTTLVNCHSNNGQQHGLTFWIAQASPGRKKWIRRHQTVDREQCTANVHSAEKKMSTSHKRRVHHRKPHSAYRLEILVRPIRHRQHTHNRLSNIMPTSAGKTTDRVSHTVCTESCTHNKWTTHKHFEMAPHTYKLLSIACGHARQSVQQTNTAREI
jgi:hypothetical protein